MPPSGYLKAACDLCHCFGVLLILDEVQTGLGRTGTLFACEAEGVIPDILALAKALGGGLVPIGACLYTGDAYSEEFDLRHGSTFAGNTLACRAALATLDELIKDDRRLVHHVAAVGQRLLDHLRQLQSDYPLLVADVRGRGLMLGVELDFEHAANRGGMLAVQHEQGLMLLTLLSYLLNVEHIRIAASFTHGSVLRIEPSLIADWPMCERLIDALRRLLEILQQGDACALLGHLVGGTSSPALVDGTNPKRGHRVAPVIPSKERGTEEGRFAFVVHQLDARDMRRFDASLEPFSDAQLESLRSRFTEFIRPFATSELAVRSPDGKLAEGELIVLPHSPSELVALSTKAAADLVQSAVDLAAERGAKVIGLAGFSSIITGGGLALRAPAGVSLTSGNSFTSWSAIRAVEAGCAKHGVLLSDCTVAIVGATGAIGQALSLLCAERAAELILIGNPRVGGTSLGELQEVAEDCKRHVELLAAGGRTFGADTFAHRVLHRRSSPCGASADRELGVTISTDIDRHLPAAHIVLTATNAVRPFISARHLRQGAIVCDVSRPLNLSPELKDERPDLLWVDGGLVQAPDGSLLGFLEEQDRHKVLMACAAETMILTLSGFRSERLCGKLDVAVVEELGRLAQTLGILHDDVRAATPSTTKELVANEHRNPGLPRRL